MRLIIAVALLSFPALAEVNVSGAERSASLLQGESLEGSYRPSQTPALRLSDDVRLSMMTVAALDSGGGLSQDARQILALVLGFIPGFGLGHLIARNQDGFILFLVIDLILYVAWGVGWWFWPFGYIGGIVWLVVHIFQALDAYASAGGERLIRQTRERALRVAYSGAGSGRDGPAVTTRIFALSF